MNRKVKFCIRIHQGGYSYENLRQICKEADRLGYDSFSLYDLLNVPTLECWTTLTALTAETERIRFVPLVLANLYRNPALLAKMAATFDVISNGRLVLGIGAGGGEGDHLASGIPYPSVRVRVEMLDESVRVIKMLWSGSRASFEGKYYRLHDALCNPAPVQKPHPPILIGGRGEKHLLRAVAAHADINNMGFNMGLEEHARRRELIRSYCERVGRNASEIETSQNANVFIGRDDIAVEEILSAQAAKSGRLVEDYKNALGDAIVGTPEECAAQIERYVDSGITYFFLLFPDPVDLEQVTLFAEQVMPRFAG